MIQNTAYISLVADAMMKVKVAKQSAIGVARHRLQASSGGRRQAVSIERIACQAPAGACATERAAGFRSQKAGASAEPTLPTSVPSKLRY